MKTIKEAKAYLRENSDKGCRCPVCDQNVKIYKRPLNSGMAVTLIRIFLTNRRKWVNVKKFLREHNYCNNHDWTILRYWGLMEEDNRDPDHGGRTAGVWRVTVTGELFIHTASRMSKRVVIYNTRFQRFEGPDISIIEALGSKFDYHELMQGE